jgi:hypothetical protein
MENLPARGNSQNNAERSHDDGDERLNFWLERDAEIRERKRLFRRERHEADLSLMLRPIAARDAFGHFGFLVGTLPPAAIFYVSFHRQVDQGEFFLLSISVLMTVVCGFVGCAVAKGLSQTFLASSRDSWSLMLLTAPFLGAFWGIVTGFFGGLLFFGVGAIVGMILAAPIGAVVFTIFAVLYRIFERGTQIDRRHLLPIIYGISLAAAAFILGL